MVTSLQLFRGWRNKSLRLSQGVDGWVMEGSFPWTVRVSLTTDDFTAALVFFLIAEMSKSNSWKLKKHLASKTKDSIKSQQVQKI